MPPDRRSKLERKAKKFLSKHAGAKLVEFQTPSEILAFHRRARAVAEKTYQEHLFRKACRVVGVRFRDEGRAESTPSRVRGFLLQEGDRDVAYLYANVEARILTCEFIGYDPAYKDASPGNVLQFLVLERVFQSQSCDMFDFGEGESQYKECFLNRSCRCADIYYFSAIHEGRCWRARKLACSSFRDRL